MGETHLSELVPLGGSVFLTIFLLRMWAAERVRWLRAEAKLKADQAEQLKAVHEEHAAELQRRDNLCEHRVAFWRDAAERYRKLVDQ